MTQLILRQSLPKLRARFGSLKKTRKFITKFTRLVGRFNRKSITLVPRLNFLLFLLTEPNLIPSLNTEQKLKDLQFLKVQFVRSYLSSLPITKSSKFKFFKPRHQLPLFTTKSHKNEIILPIYTGSFGSDNFEDPYLLLNSATVCLGSPLPSLRFNKYIHEYLLPPFNPGKDYHFDDISEEENPENINEGPLYIPKVESLSQFRL